MRSEHNLDMNSCFKAMPEEERKLKEECQIDDADWINAFQYLNTPPDHDGPDSYDEIRGI